METWTDEELVAKWHKAGQELTETLEKATPLFRRLSSLEMQIQALKNEIIKRGVSTHNGEENG